MFDDATIAAATAIAAHRRWASQMLGNLSRLINRATGGKPGETLCARIAARHGANCLFCRMVGWFTEPDHCARELRG